MNNKTKDMTEGNPVKLILWFAIPLFIGNIFQQVYNMVDTAIAGHYLGDDAIAAIGATSTIYSLLIALTMGSNSGFGIVVARYFGAKDMAKLKESIAAMFRLNITISAVLTVLSLLLIRPLMRLLNTPEEIFEQAFCYIGIILAGLIMTSLYNMCAGMLRAVGNSKTPLYFLIISSILNIVMDIAFVVVIPLGMAGIAIATVIAQTCSVVFCLVYIFKNYKELLPIEEKFKTTKDMTKEMLGMGFSMALMNSVFSIGSVILQSAINNLGTTVITAHTAARKILEMCMQPLSTIGLANSTFVGQNWGAGKVDRIKSTIKKVYVMELIWAAIAFVVMYVFGRQIVTLLIGTADEQVLDYAVMNIRINFALFPPLGILFVTRNAMQSMGYKVMPVISSGIELLMKVISAYFIVPKFGYMGASFTEPSTWVVCAAFLVICYIVDNKKIYAAKTTP